MKVSSGYESFVDNLAGEIANADWPDMGPALKAIDEMKKPPEKVESPDFERLDKAVSAAEEAIARRKQRDAEKKKREAEKLSKKRAAEAARNKRSKPKYRFEPSNPSDEPGPEGPEMGL